MVKKFFIRVSGLVLVWGAVGMAEADATNYTRFTNGTQWLDNTGAHINAHGGGILYENGYYYWFGENRHQGESYGVSCYRSQDLYNWENMGLALTPSGDPKYSLQDVAPGRTLERPKVVYNKKTGKYVMWFHWEDGTDYSKARAGVAVADNIEGPYRFVRNFRPHGEMSRDQTVFVDSDEQAYHIRASEDNMTLQCSLLTDDYQNVSDTWKRIIVQKQYEAPAIMRAGDTYFGFFSGCTGWDPNPGHLCMTKNLMGSWTDLGNPCPDANAETTYYSQSTFVLKLADSHYENAYIYMGDRWNKSNIQVSTYVWLPVRMRSGYPILNWRESWDLSVFEKMYRFKRAKELLEGNTYALLARISDRLLSDKSGFCVYDDDDTFNLQFVFEAVDGTENIYKLRDVKSGKYLNGSGSSLSLAAASASVSQQWKFTRQSDSYYIVRNQSSGNCLTVKDGSKANAAAVTLEKESGGAGQKFGLYFDTDRFDYEIDDFFEQTVNNTPVGLEWTDFGESEDIFLYPSLNDGNFTIEPGERFSGTRITITVWDVTGKAVFTDERRETDESVRLFLHGRLPQGLYTVTLHNEKETTVTKMIVK